MGLAVDLNYVFYQYYLTVTFEIRSRADLTYKTVPTFTGNTSLSISL